MILCEISLLYICLRISSSGKVFGLCILLPPEIQSARSEHGFSHWCTLRAPRLS